MQLAAPRGRIRINGVLSSACLLQTDKVARCAGVGGWVAEPYSRFCVYRFHLLYVPTTTHVVVHVPPLPFFCWLLLLHAKLLCLTVRGAFAVLLRLDARAAMLAALVGWT